MQSDPFPPLRRLMLLVLAASAGCAAHVPTVTTERLGHTAQLNRATGAQNCPKIEATVDGEKVELLVDTGSAVNALTRSFVLRHDIGTDASGEAHGMVFLPRLATSTGTIRLQLARYVSVSFPSGKPGKLDFWVGDFEEVFGPHIAGVLSPQSLLSSDQALTIDLRSHELHIGEPTAEVAKLKTRYPNPLVSRERCQDWSLGVAADVTKVHVLIDGVPATLIVDTGATNTSLWERSSAASKATADQRVAVFGLAGRGQARLWRDAPIEIGGATLRASVLLLSHPLGCDAADGLLGMDILQHCTMVWESDRLWLGCKLPEQPSSSGTRDVSAR